MSEINTHNLRVDFGRHKGELYTRLPVSYLRWMVNEGVKQADLAQTELERRGTVVPEVEISGHAIDRASLRCRKRWHESRHSDEGLHAWLVRLSMEALQYPVAQSGEIIYEGMKFVFTFGECYPTLKTIMPVKKAQGEQEEV